jgi:DNA-binding transcriptional regulator PaaX
LEVGRSRLSQIYNGMRRKGLLSVRKQGRTRYFKLSEAANQHLRGAQQEAA